MKHQFEHKNQHILPLDQFIFRALKFFLFSIIFIAFSLGIGTLVGLAVLFVLIKLIRKNVSK